MTNVLSSGCRMYNCKDKLMSYLKKIQNIILFPISFSLFSTNQKNKLLYNISPTGQPLANFPNIISVLTPFLLTSVPIQISLSQKNIQNSFQFFKGKRQ